MIYTCIAGGIRSPPAFFLKNKYKEPMKMQNENTKRVWLYARIPGNDGETLRCIRECAAKAEQDNCKIVGTSADERYGWLLRPGYREMMRQVKAGEIDCIYIYRMRQISGKEQHLFRFFQQVMQHGIKVALQGAVLYLVIGFYPALAGSLGTGGSITEQAWAMLGQSVILLVAVFMSGKFTKAITNAMT